MRIGKDWMRYMYCYGKAEAGIDGSSAPDTASNIGSYCIIIGAGVDGSSAPDTASNYGIKWDLLGPVLINVVLPIPPVNIG